MGAKWKQAAVLLLLVPAAIQVWRPHRTNPPTDPAETIEAVMPAAQPAVAAMNRACRDCHSNGTNWPWYSHIAPVSWLVVRDVVEGREAVNFSKWATYDPARRQKLLKEACSEVREGEMPLRLYRWQHPEASLTPADVDAVCQAADLGEASGG